MHYKLPTLNNEFIKGEDYFLLFETGLCDKEYNFYRRKGYLDVIFLNKQGKLTEGAISNIIIRKNKRYYTPPVSSGILPGIFRQYLIHQHRVKEKILTLQDLKKADKIFLCNSVRGLTEVKLK